MTKEEMKALVSAKIAGQGNQVDLGNALPTIINAIIDALPGGGGGGELPRVRVNFDTAWGDDAKRELNQLRLQGKLVGTIAYDPEYPQESMIIGARYSEGDSYFYVRLYQPEDGEITERRVDIL